MSGVCDFDLSQAFEGPVEEDERRSNSSSVAMMQAEGDVQEAEEETYQLDASLDLVVSRSRTGLQRMANLILATNRMKKPSKLCSDAQLCDTLLDHVVQETVLKSHVSATAAAPEKPIYIRVQSGDLCHLLDHSQKAVVKARAGMVLQAITLKGGNEEHRVRFKMAKYVHACGPDDGGGWTVALSIGNSSLHISCSMECGIAVLTLEECNKADLQMVGADENMKRFLFIKRTYGISLTKFESVRCRGWFISTSSDCENEPVEMCEADSGKRCCHFNMR